LIKIVANLISLLGIRDHYIPGSCFIVESMVPSSGQMVCEHAGFRIKIFPPRTRDIRMSSSSHATTAATSWVN
jgi:hypothetical protein